MGHGLKRALLLPVLLKRAIASALAHDCLNLGRSAAYSAMIALFPALVVAGAAIALLPDAAPLKTSVGEFFDGVLPAPVFPILRGYFSGSPRNPHTLRALVLAAGVSLSGASSVIAILMQGLLRAERLASDSWTFWQRRARALALVPLSLVPLLLATVLVMFGRWISVWVAALLPPEVRPEFFLLVLAARWVVALGGVAGVTALIYHMGMPKRQSWRRTLPGALMATALWFVTTLAFGWYVTRFANYSLVYGSLGAGIALLLWLYIVFLSVLCGAEFNVQFRRWRLEAGVRLTDLSDAGRARGK